MTDPPIRTIGTLHERVGPVLYRASLPNGKSVLAHLSKPLFEAKAEFVDGTRVHLELTPYDFDTARITGEAI